MDDAIDDGSKVLVRRSPIFLGVRVSSLFNRFSAKGIDVLIAVALFFLLKTFWLWLGLTTSMLYLAFHDALANGQSMGKRVMGLRVIEEPTGLPCTLGASLIRNLPFVVGILAMLGPYFLVLSLLLVLPVMIIEGYLVICLDTGVRLGDIVANTLVVEYDENFAL